MLFETPSGELPSEETRLFTDWLPEGVSKVFAVFPGSLRIGISDAEEPSVIIRGFRVIRGLLLDAVSTTWDCTHDYDWVIGSDVPYAEGMHPHLRRIFETPIGIFELSRPE